MTSEKTGWEPENRKHFDDIVDAYDRRRSDYPNELYDDIFKYSAVEIDVESQHFQNSNLKALEIGAGTGKATVPFLDAAYNVTAVEIGANMSAFLQDKFKENKNFCVINSSFEDVILEDNNYDMIYAASAFHWVDPKIGCPKVFRLLKSGGTVAMFRFNAIAAVGEELYENIQAEWEKYYYSYYISNERPVKKTKEDFLKPSEIYHSFKIESLQEYGFTNVTMCFYDDTRIFNADEYIEWLSTMSDVRGLPEDNKKALFLGIKEVIKRHGGYHHVDHIFQLYMGRKP